MKTNGYKANGLWKEGKDRERERKRVKVDRMRCMNGWFVHEQ